MIDYEVLEKKMLELDLVLSDLDAIGKDLVIQQYTAKIRKDRLAQQQHDVLGQMDFKSLMAGMMSKKKDE